MKDPFRFIPLFLVGVWLIVGLSFTARAGDVPPVVLAKEQKALLPVVVPETASPRVKKIAETLARYLGQMSGALFQVTAGDGQTGIAVGAAREFSALKDVDPTLLSQKATDREDYLLASHAKGVYLLGNTDLAVEHAVWDFLHRLGYRQFFPRKTWEIVPRLPEIGIAVRSREHPSFHSRRIWYTAGMPDYTKGPYEEWCARNRATAGIAIESKHIYDYIRSQLRKDFEAHPEWIGLVNGQRKSYKFCLSNRELRKTIVEWAVKHMESHPERDSVSMEPSDGSDWCECKECAAMGSVSDRVVTLANEVAAGINAGGGPEKLVGIYAYNKHAVPPSFQVNPHVVVSIATAYISGGLNFDQLMDGWQAKGAVIGIREFLSLHPWDRDMPGRASAADLAYLQRKVPYYHAKGARYFSAQMGDSWGPYGLGYYLTVRMLWDVKESERMESIIDDFLDKSFGPARKPMAKFYQLLDARNHPRLSDDLLGRMYRLLQEAYPLAPDDATRERIDHLTLYVRYLEILQRFVMSSGPEHQAILEELIKYSYRMKDTGMVHSHYFYRDIARRDRNIEIPAEAKFNVPEGKNPWKSSEPFTAKQIAEMRTNGIAGFKILDVEPVGFSLKLVPAAPLKLRDSGRGHFGEYGRGIQHFYTWVKTPDEKIDLTLEKGLVLKDSRGFTINTSLFRVREGDEDILVDEVKLPFKASTETVSLKAKEPGLHRIEVSDFKTGTRVTWPEKTPMTLEATYETPTRLGGRWSLYFYVPRGTRVVAGYRGGDGELRDGDGAPAAVFDKAPGFFSVPVPPGQDGKLWRFHNSARERVLLTVPPYLAASADELLLPEEVVRKDSPASTP